MKPKRLDRTTIYTSEWVNLHVDKVEFPEGHIIEKHHLVELVKDGVGILVENEANEILLVQAYRYATESIEWEIPAGGREEGDSVIETAKRETLEETGYHTCNHKIIYTYYPMTGISNQIFNIVRCKATENVGEFDQNEIKGFRWFSRDKIREMIKDRVIKDGLALTALLLLILIDQK